MMIIGNLILWTLKRVSGVIVGWFSDEISVDLSSRKKDIISMLVGIYGTHEMFINEYRYANML